MIARLACLFAHIFSEWNNVAINFFTTCSIRRSRRYFSKRKDICRSRLTAMSIASSSKSGYYIGVSVIIYNLLHWIHLKRKKNHQNNLLHWSQYYITYNSVPNHNMLLTFIIYSYFLLPKVRLTCGLEWETSFNRREGDLYQGGSSNNAYIYNELFSAP